MPPVCVQGSLLHKSIGHPCVHDKPNPAPEPTDSIWKVTCIYCVSVWFGFSYRPVNKWPSLCGWTSPSSKDFPEAVTYQLCGSLGSAPRWVEKNIPLGTPPHPTAPRKLKAHFDLKLAAIPMPVRVCEQYQMFSQDVGRSRTSQLTGAQGLCNVLGSVQGHLGIHYFLLAQHREECMGQIQWKQQEGTNRVRQVLWYSILHWCQLFKSFFPISDGAAWNLQIAGASLKDAAWARKALVFARSHSPRDRRNLMGAKRMGNSSLFNHMITTVFSNLLNTCLFCAQVVSRRQWWFTMVCPDCELCWHNLKT